MAVAQKKLAGKTVARPVDAMIHVIRRQKVMLDSDLAELYGIQTWALNQAVKRNADRFPDDFMFRLSLSETKRMISQSVISSKRKLTNQPLVFTEHGVAMLSSVLKSSRAVQMNILIIRAFIRMREVLATDKELKVRIEKLEDKYEVTDVVIETLVEDIENINRDIHWIKNPPLKPKHRMGFYVEKGGKD